MVGLAWMAALVPDARQHLPDDETTRFPDETTRFPDETTRFPDETTRFPDEATRFPDEATRFPDEATRFPDEATRFPDEATRFPDETTRFPDETTRFPDETTRFPDETAWPAVERELSMPDDDETLDFLEQQIPSMATQAYPGRSRRDRGNDQLRAVADFETVAIWPDEQCIEESGPVFPAKG